MTSDDLLRQIPDFLRRITVIEDYDGERVCEAMREAGLEPLHRGRGRFAFQHIDSSAASTFQRRLPSAVTRVLGKPSGGDRHWEAGCASASLVFGDGRVSVFLRPHVSLASLRSAATAWLDGMDLRPWLVRSGFVDGGAQPTGEGRWPIPSHDLVKAKVRTPATTPTPTTETETETETETVSLEAGVRPLGTIPAVRRHPNR